MDVGRELELMLSGQKMMAAFSYLPAENVDYLSGQNFDKYVKNGTLERRKFYVKNHRNINVVYSVFFFPSEEWRYLLYRVLKKSTSLGWNREKEQIECMLLGNDPSYLANT